MVEQYGSWFNLESLSEPMDKIRIRNGRPVNKYLLKDYMRI